MGVFRKKRSCNLSISGRKGQFTLFIIVGLVIFAVFAFALFAKAKTASLMYANQADLQIKDYVSKNAIDQYVTGCLDAVSDDVFLLASMQGGLLNSSGKIEGKDYIVYHDDLLGKDFNVSITIDANYGCPYKDIASANYLVTQTPGLYPYNCVSSRFTDVAGLPNLFMKKGLTSCENGCGDARDFSGFFGINNLSALCDDLGPNAVRTGINSQTCDYYDYQGNSMQNRLQKKIAQDMDKCVNFTQILERTPSNITMIGNVSASVIFGKSALTVKLEYPFTVMMRNKQPITRMVDFSIDKNLAFKELYEYTYELSNYDVKDARFNIINNRDDVISKSTIRKGKNIYDGYIVYVKRGDLQNGFIDLVQITDPDTNHRIRGVPLRIDFAIRNRAPALDYIGGKYSLYDIVATGGDTINITPKGYDPDDDTLTYNYSGWLENHVDEFDWAGCASATTLEEVIKSCTKSTPVDEADSPHSWTQSENYVKTQANASFRVSNSDTGFHTVRVTVVDEEGKTDYQDIGILVYDTPVAVISATRPYSDIDENRASLEDKYVLSGIDSTVGRLAALLPNAAITSFTWEDSKVPFILREPLTNGDASKELNLPDDVSGTYNGGAYTPTPYDITNINNVGFGKNKDALGDHDIILTVKTTMGLEASDKYTVTVSKCLPHKNSNVFSYPYSILSGASTLDEHLEADHTCCIANGDTYNYADSNTPCYSSTKYGMIRYFQDFEKFDRDNNIQYNNVVNDNADRSAFSSGDYINDIFKQEFTRSCSGDRGNICSGTGVERITLQESCSDFNHVAVGVDYSRFQNASCSGPPRSYLTGYVSDASDSSPSCIGYDAGETFESLTGSGTGFCTGEKQRADGNGGTFGSGNFVCQGQCYNGGCTVPTECECAYGDTACNGLMTAQNMGSCNMRGNTYLEDRCSSNCILTKAPNRCFSGTGCSTSQTCNGRTPRTFGDNTAGNSGNNFVGCTATCTYIDCTPYRFDPLSGTSGACRTTCSSKSDCSNSPVDNYCNTANPRRCVPVNTFTCSNNAACANTIGSGYICDAATSRCVSPV